MLIIGGIGNNLGAVIGAVTYMGTTYILDYYKNQLTSLIHVDPTYLEYVIFGLIIILILMFRPQGIIPEKPVKTVNLEAIREKRRRKS
jgi:branched-chain amino acid transport system permease protein